VLRLKLDTAGSNTAGWNSVANFNYFTLNQTNGNLSQPMGLIATAPYSNRVDLSWTNDDTNAVSFNIQRSSDEDNPTWVTIKTGLRAGTNFYADTAAVGGLYRVIAVGAGGDTLASASVSVTMPDATDRPTENQPWMINFQVDRTIPVPGYLIDSGDIFGVRDNGLAYGWNIDHTIQDRERGINSDRKLDTLVHFRQGGEWSINIPDGPYDVTVSIGDPGWASTYTLNVNGVSYWNNLALAKNIFPPPKTMMINVTDGKIVLDAGTSPDRSTKINYIEITPSGDPPPPEGTPVVKIEAKTAAGVLDNTATEGQDGATFTVSRTGDTTGDLLVNYAIDTASTAGPGEYTPLLSGAVTILDGEPSASFSVTPVEDQDPEVAQQLTLRLSPDATYTRDSSATAATVTIYDNDAGSPGIDIGGGITVFPSFGDFDSRLMSVSYAQSLAIPVLEGIQELKTLDIFPMVDNDQPYQYGRDYSATLDGSDVFVDVDRWGLYIIRATYTGGSQPNVTEYWGIEFEIREMEADGDPALPDNEVGPQDVIAGDVAQYMQGAELILINKDTSDKISNWWSEALQPLGNKVQRVGNIEEAINAISTAFFANNLQPIDIVIADHGQGGLQTIGSEIKTVDNKIKHVFNPDSFIGNLDFADEPQPKRQQLLDAQAENNRRFFDACRGKVSSIDFYGCSLAKGNVGTAFLQLVASGVQAPVRAYDKMTMVGREVVDNVPTGKYRLTVEKGATRIAKQPT
jgi:hypothetical protein